NILALIVFLKTGIGDGISVSFFSITVSDLICLATFLVATLLGLLDLTFQVKPYVSLYWVSYVLPFYGLMFYNISTLLTLFLAVQKCCCVAMPIKFKNQFSRSRCLAVSVGIYGATMVTFIPFTVSALPLQPGFDIATNSTRLVFCFSPFFLNQVFPVLKGISYISIPIVSEFTVLLCTILLTVKLNQSLRFRNRAHTATTTVLKDEIFSTKTHLSPIESIPDVLLKSREDQPMENVSHRPSNEVKETIRRKTNKSRAFKKELRLTQAVNVVAFIFVVLNSPNIGIFFTSLVLPQFSGIGKYGNTYAVCLEINDLLNVINMSVNLFVYLKFNSRFKQTFVTTF
ncbi:unnamed protein product, partial [Lymnaea stagnalis]